jgi:methylglyoxal reductase
MQHNLFPATGQSVSRLGFGAMGITGNPWPFGSLSDDDASGSVLHALEKGITFIDTARGYGRSEELIGRALAQWSGPMPFVATKVPAKGPNAQWAIPCAAEEAFPKGHVTASANESLKQLGVEALDLLQLHLYWPNWGVAGHWLDELQALKAAGKVKSIGVSLPDQRCDVGLPLVLSGAIDCVQTVFHLFDPQPLDCLIPLCAQRGVGVIARCILDEGGLTGTLTKDTVFEPHDYRHGYFDHLSREVYIERVDRLRAFIPQHASSLAALALKFVLHDPGVTTAISSMHVKAYCDANVAAMEEPPLSQEAFDELRQFHRFVRNFYAAKVFVK